MSNGHSSGCLIPLYSTKLGESLLDNEEQSRIEDMAAIALTRSVVKKAPPTSTGSQAMALFGGERQDISRLVAIREAHQTRRAAKSTKSCKTQLDNPVPPPPSAASQRQKICSQMADVIRRSGTGLERNIRWISGSAPSTKDPTEVSQLSGNSANSELAAKERVNAVRDPPSPKTKCL